MGDLGKRLDDYQYVVLDPATGETRLWGGFMFSRMLGYALLFFKAGLLWNHDRIHHFICATSHGLVVLLVWSLLRRACVSRHVCAMGTLLFMACPLHYEVIFWPSAGLQTGLSVMVFLCLALAYIRYARNPSGVFWSALIPVLALVSMTTWEQPVAGIAALPLLYYAFASEDCHRRTHLRQALLPVILALALTFGWAVLQAATLSAQARGSIASFTPADEWPERLALTGKSVGRFLWGDQLRDIVRGGITEARLVLMSAKGMAWALMLGLALTAWTIEWYRRHLATGTRPRQRNGRALPVFAFGLALFFLSWVPVVTIRNQDVVPRLLYLPLIGVVLAGCVLLDRVAVWAAATSARSASFKSALIVPGAAFSLVGAVCLVSIQSNLRERYYMDRAEMDQLRELIPRPSPQTVFVPLRINNTPSHTGYHYFDEFAWGGLAAPWCATPMIQQAFRRADIFSTSRTRWGTPPFTRIARDGLCYQGYLAPQFPTCMDDGTLLKWNQVIPFIIDAKGEVHLVNRIMFEHPTGNDSIMSVPLCPPQPPNRTWSSYAVGEPLDEHHAYLEGWTWTTTEGPVGFQRTCAWGIDYPGVFVHPAYPANPDHGSMSIALPARPSLLELCFRATIPEWCISQPWGDGVELRWYLEGPRGSPLTSVLLTPRDVAALPRWIPVPVVIPPHDRQVRLFFEVTPGPAGDINYDTCVITPGCYRRPDATDHP